MDALHESLADHLLTYMRTTPAEKRTAAHLAVIRAFLHDDSVLVVDLKQRQRQAVIREKVEELANLTLPFPLKPH